MDCSPPGSSIHGVFQARILKWIAISSSRGYHGILPIVTQRYWYSWIIWINSQTGELKVPSTRVHTVWFHLYEVLKQIKLASDEINQSSGYCLWGVTGVRKEETFWGDRKILHFDKSVRWHQCLGICQHSDSTLRSVRFIPCEWHFWDFSGDPVVEGSPTNTLLTPQTQVWSLVWQAFICCRTAKPASCATEARAPSTWCFVTREAPSVRSLCTPTGEQPPVSPARESSCTEDSAQSKINNKVRK